MFYIRRSSDWTVTVLFWQRSGDSRPNVRKKLYCSSPAKRADTVVLWTSQFAKNSAPRSYSKAKRTISLCELDSTAISLLRNLNLWAFERKRGEEQWKYNMTLLGLINSSWKKHFYVFFQQKYLFNSEGTWREPPPHQLFSCFQKSLYFFAPTVTTSSNAKMVPCGMLCWPFWWQGKPQP